MGKHSVCAVLYVVLKSFVRLFTSSRGNLTIKFEKQLADSTEKKYQNRQQLVHVLRHWREDEEFARQARSHIHCQLFLFVTVASIVMAALASKENIISLIHNN